MRDGAAEADSATEEDNAALMAEDIFAAGFGAEGEESVFEPGSLDGDEE